LFTEVMVKEGTIKVKKAEAKRPWEPMRLKDVGHVSQLVTGGGGKLTPSPADPGEERKPPGQG
jgi:hypothetical protein